MVITIGTPNKGSFISDARNLVCDNPTILPSIAENIQPGLCTQWTAAGAMSVFNSKISQLPMLPTAIPIVHAIAGDQHLVWKVLNATVDAPIDGDGVVPLWSALAKRPGGTQDTFDRVTNPLVPANWSAMHLELQRNTSIMQLVTGYVSGWIREHPLPAASACPTSGDVPGAADCYAHPPATAQPAAAPALGGDAYWLADGGRWYVHDAGLRISRGPSGLTGTETWNAYGTIVTGTIHLAFTSQPDGSLLGTYTDNTVYTTTPGRDASMFQPDPAAPRQGEVIRLVPVAPMHAKSVYVSRPGPLYANTNWCQAGLPNGWKWCGA
jgi:hypothetical protein